MTLARIADRRGIASLTAVLLLAVPSVGGARPSTARAIRTGANLRHAVSSTPLRDLRIPPRRPATADGWRIVDAPSAPRPRAGDRKTDPVLRSRPQPSAPTAVIQFDGATENDNLFFSGKEFVPPDGNGAAGPSNYFQTINVVLRIFDKSGNLVLGPLPNSSLWAGLGGICETDSAATPFVKYDALADRWYVSQAATDFSDGSSHECIAVSTTGDPTGTYAQYDFVVDPSSSSGRSRVGIWPEAYYVTINQFSGFNDAGFGIYAFDRAAMLAGGAATYQYANPGAANPGAIWGSPADLDGTTPPPDGAPNVSIALGAAFLDGSPSDLVHVWSFHADFSNPDASTFTGPVDVPIAPFSPLDCGNGNIGEGCVPQLGSGQLIQALPSILMYRLAYRNFGDHESLVTNFTVNGSEAGAQAAIRWFELRDPNGTPAIYQQGTYVPDASHRFIGSIAMDRAGNVALGYSKSDETIHPSLAVTGRLLGDPLGTMGSENAFFEGPGSLPPVVGFWGRTSAMTIDPADDCTFWFTAEYIGEPAPFFEYTRIGSFKFESCSTGPTGILAGTVTASGSGDPIAGARVTAGASETLTDSNGHYQFLTLPVGTYDMTVTKFGVFPGSASGVVVSAGETTTQDFVLAIAPPVLLNGVVTDGSGAGWQLYARLKVSAPGFGEQTIFTDPVTGYYAITLVSGVTYAVTVETVLPGYPPAAASIFATPPTNAPGGIVLNFALPIDSAACTAPGYGLVAQGLTEGFDAGVLPPGWSIVNNSGGGPWSIHTGPDPCGVFPGNDTGGSGPYALVNSHCDGEVTDDTELITPSVDLSAFSSAQIRFAQELNGRFPPAGESVDVDVSTDGGSGWTNVLHETSSVLGPNTQVVDITSIAAGQPDVKVRFHYYNAFEAWWWQLDDIVVGQATCAPLHGGLVVGNVLDANTGAGLNGAVVANLPQPGSPATTTFATPDDPAQPDGLYVLFAESSAQSFTASLDLYAPQTKNLTVVPNRTQRLDFALAAGLLDASPRPLSARVDPGQIVTLDLDMHNGGTADAGFLLDELNVPPLSGAAPATGRRADPALRARVLARVPPALRDAGSTRGIAPLADAPSARVLVAGNVVNAYPSGLQDPWGVAFDTDVGDFWVSNRALLGGDNKDYRFLTDGTNTGDTIDDSGWVAEFAGDGTYDPRTQMLWRVNVGGDDCIYELDPTARVATGNKICPAFGTSQRGLAYDPATDTFYSGSWNDGVINHFDASGTILDSAYVAVPISGLAFNTANGHLYALTNHDVLGGFDVYVFDTHASYNPIGAFFVTSGGTPVMTAFGGAGLEIDCNGHLWLVDNGSKTIYEVETGESGVCAFQEIPWLSEDPTEGTVGASATLPVVCTFDSTGLSAGVRLAQLMVHTDTPYAVAAVPVALTVRFADVLDSNPFEAFIYGAAGAGVMPGCDPGAFEFCPDALVTRADMAGFILRAVHGAGFVPEPYAGAFLDVSADDFNADYIQSFFDEGYTAGCGGGNFCPGAVHTRGQTAVFILKGIHGTSYLPPPCGSTHVFDDVPCPPTPEAPFGDWIGQLFLEGITAGCGGNNFCPNAGIPNQQMATFLVKAFGIPHL